MNNKFKLNLRNSNSELTRTFNHDGKVKKVVLEFTNNVITGNTFDLNGQLIDSFEIK